MTLRAALGELPLNGAVWDVDAYIPGPAVAVTWRFQHGGDQMRGCQ